MADNAIIDSHAHLDYPQLADDLPAVLARADAAGVSHVITIGVKLSKSDAPKALRVYINLCKKYGIPVEEGGILYGDNEIVLNSKEVNESAASEGMLRGNSNEYEPWQNAGVESVFRI